MANKSYTISIKADMNQLINQIKLAQQQLDNMGAGIDLGSNIDFATMKKEFQKALEGMQADINKLKLDQIEFEKINTQPLEDLIQKFQQINNQIKNLEKSWGRIDFSTGLDKMSTSLTSFKEAVSGIETIFNNLGLTSSQKTNNGFENELQSYANIYEKLKKVRKLENQESFSNIPKNLIDLKKFANAAMNSYSDASATVDDIEDKISEVKIGTKEYNNLLAQQATALLKAQTEATKLYAALNKIYDLNNISDQDYGNEKIMNSLFQLDVDKVGGLGTYSSTYAEIEEYIEEASKKAQKAQKYLSKLASSKGFNIEETLSSNKQGVAQRVNNKKIEFPVSLEIDEKSLNLSERIKTIINDAQAVVKSNKIELDLSLKTDTEIEKSIRNIASKSASEIDIYDRVSKIYNKLEKENAKKVKEVFGFDNSDMASIVGSITSNMETMSQASIASIDKIISAIDRVIDSLEKLSTTTKLAFNLPSDSELNKQWTNIQEQFNNLSNGDEKIDMRKNKVSIDAMLRQYKKYISGGGTKTLGDLTSNAITVEKLGKQLNKIDLLDEQALKAENVSLSELKANLIELSSVVKNFNASSASFEKAAERIATNLNKILNKNATKLDAKSLLQAQKAVEKSTERRIKDAQKAKELFLTSESNFDNDVKYLDFDKSSAEVKAHAEDIINTIEKIREEAKIISEQGIELIKEDDIAKLRSYASQIEHLFKNLKTLYNKEGTKSWQEAKDPSNSITNDFTRILSVLEAKDKAIRSLVNEFDGTAKTNTFNQVLNTYVSGMDDIQQHIQSFREKDINLITDEDINQLMMYVNSYEELEHLVNGLAKNKNYNRFDPVKGTVVKEQVGSYRDALEAVKQLSEARGGMIKDMRITQATNDTAKFTSTIKTQSGEVQRLSYVWDQASGNIRQVVTTMKQGQSGMAAFTNSIKDGFVRFGKYFTGDRIISSLIRNFKNGLAEIKELDSAFTEMQKVSDESILSLKKFSNESFNIGKSIGATGLEIQQSSAEWMRLGYSLKEAGELAKNSALYSNVGDMDINTATEHLLSSVKAFREEFSSEVEASYAIVDRFNEIGNNFAIDSESLGSSFERSAAALVAGGNTLNQALGLTTAGNLVIQDADTVGNALKIVALRTRGKPKICAHYRVIYRPLTHYKLVA